jgi:hypothetical protein
MVSLMTSNVTLSHSPNVFSYRSTLTSRAGGSTLIAIAMHGLHNDAVGLMGRITGQGLAPYVSPSWPCSPRSRSSRCGS